ncbi:MAG: hypothetical protein ABIJ05_00910 [Patescibacteria group bacterium]
MDDYVRNSLSGVSMLRHQAFREYLLEHGKDRDFSYTLDEFGWELGINSLRKGDADIVMGFLSDVAKTIGTESLEIRTQEGNDLPFAKFKGEKFPNTSIELRLEFMQPYAGFVTHGAEACSDTIYSDLTRYQGSDEHVAWEQALKEICKRTSEGSKEGIQWLEEAGKLHFKAETSTQNDFQYTLSLTEIFNRTVDITRAVEQSHQATKRMMKLYDDRISGLAQKMMQQAPSQ